MHENDISLEDLCPCGSGRTIIRCCFTKRCNTKPPGPQTGISNARCYARELKDCSKDNSREHYISANILEQIGIGGEILDSELPPSPTGEPKAVPVRALGEKILCKRHNEALSDLDQLAGRLFNFIKDPAPMPPKLFINGEELERWMLKLLCGYASSKNAIFGSEKLRDWRPPLEWLQILFDAALISPNYGLYCMHVNRTFYTRAGGISTEAAMDPHSKAIEIAIMLEGVPLILSTYPRPTRETRLAEGIELVHRPKSMTVILGKSQKIIHTGWLDGQNIRIKRHLVEKE